MSRGEAASADEATSTTSEPSPFVLNFTCPADNNLFRPVTEIGIMPRMRCKVCGVSAASADLDGRPGFYSGTVSFGPNQVDGMINETIIREYRVYYIDVHMQKSSMIAAFNRSVAESNTACCDTETYQFNLKNVPVAEYAGAMVVPVDTNGVEMPLGEVVMLPDVTTTSTPIVEVEETTIRVERQAGSSSAVRCCDSALLLGTLLVILATMRPWRVAR